VTDIRSLADINAVYRGQQKRPSSPEANTSTSNMVKHIVSFCGQPRTIVNYPIESEGQLSTYVAKHGRC